MAKPAARSRRAQLLEEIGKVVADSNRRPTVIRPRSHSNRTALLPRLRQQGGAAMTMFRIPIAALAFAALAVPASAQRVDNDAYARDMSGLVTKNPFGLCWRTYSWTPDKAIAECDPELVKKPTPVVRPTAAAAPPPPPPPAPVAAPVAAAPIVAAPVVVPPPAPVKRTVAVTLGADATFDTGKADLKPQGRAKLDDVAAKLTDASVTIDSMIVTGHTDNVGSAAANQKLSEQRAAAVKTYLVGKGLDGSKIRTQGKGLTQPVADNKTAQGRAQNRRVEVEVTGARAQ
ncbi:MAG TPA: OmpA family protein [Burkholderiales bacterium]|nr:OmpA family protein [Burkholderiales bacterium]